MSGKRVAIYLMLLAGLGALVWVLVSRTDDGDRSEPRSVDRAGKPRPRRGMQLPGLPEGDREPVLLTMVQGKVVDGDSGKPVGEVQLTFRSGATSGSGVTDGSGAYQVELPGGTYAVTLRAATHVAPRGGVRVQVEQGSPVRWLDFTVYRLATLAGRVVSSSASPVPGAVVQVERARGPRAFDTAGLSTATDAQGRFTLKVPPGEVVLRADAGKLGAALSSNLYTRPGAHVEGITIQVGQGLTLTGKVVGPGGQRANGAMVLVRDELGLRRLPCDTEGNFAAGGLTPGPKVLQASARDFSPSPVTQLILRDQAVHVVLTVTASRGVGGQVVDGEGAPLGGITVTVRPGSPGSRMAHLGQPQQQTTTADGHFMFTQVPDAPLALTARGPGNMSASRSGVAPGTFDNMLRLQATGAIVGQVTEGMGGKPVRDFTVAVAGAEGTGNPYDGQPRVRVVSPSGNYTLENLVSGTYRLVFTADGYGAVEKNRVPVVAGSNAQVNVVLDASGEVAGVVVDSRGVGIPGASVRLDTGWFGSPAITDAEGLFQLKDVARGRRSLAVTHPSYDTRIVSGISIFAGQKAQVRVELSSSGGKKPGLRLSGIGVVLTNRAGQLVVVKVVEGSPAQVAGIKAADQILTINGSQMKFQDAIESIRGLIGTPVRLRLQRGERAFDVNVIRDEVTVP